MTIQDLGSIGEVVAAVATVATLIYLALQIRASTQVARAESRRHEMDAGATWVTSIVENPDVARIFRAGLAGDVDLSSEEGIRFNMLMGQVVGAEAAFFDEVRAGVGTASRIDERAISIVRFLSTPGGSRWWEQYSPGFGQEFRQYYQSKVDASKPAAQQGAAADSA